MVSVTDRLQKYLKCVDGDVKPNQTKQHPNIGGRNSRDGSQQGDSFHILVTKDTDAAKFAATLHEIIFLSFLLFSFFLS